jgi:hypothetical protein
VGYYTPFLILSTAIFAIGAGPLDHVLRGHYRQEMDRLSDPGGCRCRSRLPSTHDRRPDGPFTG